MLTALPGRGIPLGDVLADSGYSHRIPQNWASPLRAAGAQLVQLELGPLAARLLRSYGRASRRSPCQRHPLGSPQEQPAARRGRVIAATPDGQQSFISMVGEYDDELAKTGGRWLFTRRTVSTDGTQYRREAAS